ncbi:hypothetical protein RCH16_003527 [Cryobacterium sp. MP_M5]|uniref:hypothetical protein n=1 Tax=unclassified Cryobacterium TaxID=2649013 RepID=UPI0018C9DD7E|nr:MULTISPECIES: hypothetical protein [unclassified Cryobacterium]MBG6060070.1 hypothetical protein [Cryobacterium sp. MP_M3]MEC5178488.1 hypothetical protein [Cryobacterium sp. MP_M5]
MWDTMSASREKREELHELYLRGLKPAQVHLRSRLNGPSDPQLDGSVESLDAVNEWFLAHIKERHETQRAELPSWWDPSRPTSERGAPGSGPFTSAQLALIDEVQAYFGEVLTATFPDAEWVIYKGHKNDFRNGLTMLQLGKGRPFPVRDMVYKEALGVVLSGRDVAVDTLSRLVLEESAARA